MPPIRKRSTRALLAGSVGLLTLASPGIAPASAAPSAATSRFLDAAAKVEQQGYVRQKPGGKVELKGWIDVVPSENKGGSDTYLLHTGKNEIERLKVGSDTEIVDPSAKGSAEPELTPGQVVTVAGAPGTNGSTTAQTVTVQAALAPPGLTPVATARRAPSTRKILVLRLNFNNQPVLATPAEITTTYLTGPRSAHVYFNTVSDGEISFTADISPVLTMTNLAKTSAASCAANEQAGLTPVAQAAEQAAALAGIDTSAYDHVSYVYEDTAPCNKAWGSYSSRISWVAAQIYINNPGTVAHEIGHNLGMAHSSTETCTASTGVVLPTGSGCTPNHYEDRQDIMGFDLNGYLSGFHKAQLGFLPLSGVAQADPAVSTSYTLKNVSTTEVGVTQVLRIPRPNATDGRPNYFLDFRKSRSPYDVQPAYAPINNGVALRTTAGYTDYGVDPMLVGASPGDGKINGRTGAEKAGNPGVPVGRDEVLGLKQSFWDPVENYSVTVDAVTATTATVTVSPGPPPGNKTNVSVLGGVVSVNAGLGKRNNVILTKSGSDVVVYDTGAAVNAGTGCTAINAISARCPAAGVTAVNVRLEDYDDNATVSSANPFGLPVTFYGGSGSDALYGSTANDWFDGGTGADIIRPQGGLDSVSYIGRTEPLTMTTNTGTTWDDGAVGEYDDIDWDIRKFYGGSGIDTMSLLNPNDLTVYPNGGADQVTTGSGNDKIYARQDGAADTTLVCGAGTTDRLMRDSGDATSSTCEYTGVTPDTTITSGPAAGSSSSSTSATFGFTSAEVATFMCKWDTGAAAPCTSPATRTGLSVGSHTFSVYAISEDDLADLTPDTRTFTVTGGPPIVVSAPATMPTAVNLSTDPVTGTALDWIHWKGVNTTDFDRKNATQQISGLTPMHTGSNVTWTGPSTFSWTDAVGTASGSSAIGVARGSANGRGLKFTIPATSAATRKLKLYVGARGTSTTIALRAYFTGQTPVTTQLSSTSSTVTTNRIIEIDYRPTAATDTLTVEWFQGGGNTSSLPILYGAALF